VQIEKPTDCFGVIVKSARQANGMTQLQLAEKLQITPRYLKAIENSGRKPSFDLFIRIVHELDISVEEILYPLCLSTKKYSKRQRKSTAPHQHRI
jgi:transcriptional regulator with XRE-family HTH domain